MKWKDLGNAFKEAMDDIDEYPKYNPYHTCPNCKQVYSITIKICEKCGSYLTDPDLKVLYEKYKDIIDSMEMRGGIVSKK